MATDFSTTPPHLWKKAAVGMALLFLLVGACLFTGSVSLPLHEVVASLFGGGEERVAFIVWESRLPALLTAILAGSALGVSGGVMQTVFANPLAEPGILGVNAGASLGAAVAMLLLRGSWAVEEVVVSGFLLTLVAALVGAMVVLLLLLVCSALVRHYLTLLIIGVMVSYLVASLISLLHFYATKEGISAFVFWGFGDFGSLTKDRLAVLAVAVAMGIGGLAFFVKPLNALLLGTDYATNIGVAVRRSRTLVLLLAGWLSAVITATCGPIAFIGLAVPHMVRLLFRTANHRYLLPLSALMGANIALLCHWAAQGLSQGTALPLNAITPLVGVPFVLYLLLKKR